MMANEEVVAAFIHQSVEWKDMNTEQRLAWQSRVRYVLNDTDENGRQWTQRRVAPVLGIAHATLSRRLSWSEPQEVVVTQSNTRSSFIEGVRKEAHRTATQTQHEAKQRQRRIEKEREAHEDADPGLREVRHTELVIEVRKYLLKAENDLRSAYKVSRHLDDDEFIFDEELERVRSELDALELRKREAEFNVE